MCPYIFTDLTLLPPKDSQAEHDLDRTNLDNTDDSDADLDTDFASDNDSTVRLSDYQRMKRDRKLYSADKNARVSAFLRLAVDR